MIISYKEKHRSPNSLHALVLNAFFKMFVGICIALEHRQLGSEEVGGG